MSYFINSFVQDCSILWLVTKFSFTHSVRTRNILIYKFLGEKFNLIHTAVCGYSRKTQKTLPKIPIFCSNCYNIKIVINRIIKKAKLFLSIKQINFFMIILMFLLHYDVIKVSLWRPNNVILKKCEKMSFLNMG